MVLLLVLLLPLQLLRLLKSRGYNVNLLKSLLSNAEGIIPSDSDLLRLEELFRKVWGCLSESGKAPLQ